MLASDADLKCCLISIKPDAAVGLPLPWPACLAIQQLVWATHSPGGAPCLQAALPVTDAWF